MRELFPEKAVVRQGKVLRQVDLYPHDASNQVEFRYDVASYWPFFAAIRNGGDGSAFVQWLGVTQKPTSEQFPCPFCDCNRVDVIGGSRTFLYYRCSECAEIWSAMNLRASAPKRMRLPEDLRHPTIH